MWRRLALTFAVSGGGGAAFALAGLPAPWLSGAMIAVSIAALSGLAVAVPEWLRDVVFVFLGVSMGAGVTPESLEKIGLWPLSIIALAVVLVLILATGSTYLHRIARWEKATAFLAAVPGALSQVLALALETPSANAQKVAVSQSLRLFILVAVLPGAILWSQGAPQVPPPAAAAQGAAYGAIVLLFILGTAGGVVFRLLRVPAGLLTGALMVSATLHATEIISARLPGPVMIPGFVVLGALIGTRFAGATWRHLALVAVPALMAFALAMCVSVLGAALVSWAVDLPFGLTLLAFAPGGLETMTLLAFALSLDPAYVAAHQVARYIAMVLFLPVLMRLMTGSWPGKGKR